MLITTRAAARTRRVDPGPEGDAARDPPLGTQRRPLLHPNITCDGFGYRHMAVIAVIFTGPAAVAPRACHYVGWAPGRWDCSRRRLGPVRRGGGTVRESPDHVAAQEERGAQAMRTSENEVCGCRPPHDTMAKGRHRDRIDQRSR